MLNPADSRSESVVDVHTIIAFLQVTLSGPWVILLTRMQSHTKRESEKGKRNEKQRVFLQSEAHFPAVVSPVL